VNSDNGLLGGLVGGTAFNTTFNTPSPTIIGLIVAIYEGKRLLGNIRTNTDSQGQLDASSDRSQHLSSENSWADAKALQLVWLL
jgi:hypothetical protein